MPLHKTVNPRTRRVQWSTDCRKCDWKSRKYVRQVSATDARAAHIDAAHRTEEERAVRKMQAILLQAHLEGQRRRSMADPDYGKPFVAEVNEQPAPDRIGWCHACGTYQLGRDARFIFMAWAGSKEHGCVSCDDEPWGLGIWAPDLCASCTEAYRPLAERQDVGWDGIGCQCRE